MAGETKEYTVNFGILGKVTVDAPANSCLFCKHCTDVFYDWHGIYLTICDINADCVQGSKGECDKYAE